MAVLGLGVGLVWVTSRPNEWIDQNNSKLVVCHQIGPNPANQVSSAVGNQGFLPLGFILDFFLGTYYSGNRAQGQKKWLTSETELRRLLDSN